MKSSFKEQISSYIYIGPFLLIFLIFIGFPFVYAFFLSFHQVTSLSDVFGGLKFVGFQNYIDILKDPRFHWSLLVTIYYAALIIPMNIAFSLLLASLMRVPFKLNSVFRTGFFLPYVLDAFVVGVVWTFLLSGRFGIITNLLRPFISETIYRQGFLGTPATAMPSVATAMVLKGGGFGMILYLAAMQNIPKEVYEAASIDGASGIKKFRYITFPLLKPVTTFMVITGLIGAISAFAEFYAMTGGGPTVYKFGMPQGMTKVTGLYLFDFIQSLKLGKAAALAFILLLITLFISLLYAKLQRSK